MKRPSDPNLGVPFCPPTCGALDRFVEMFRLLDMIINLSEGSVPTISLSDETYRKLERLARPFHDSTEEDVIRRLADSALAGLNGTPLPTAPSTSSMARRDLVSHKGIVPHGTILKARYKGAEYEAEVRDGKVRWNNRSYSSLSAAAVAVIRSTGSNRGTEDGWRFWQRVLPKTS
jgi:hypothetical protein